MWFGSRRPHASPTVNRPRLVALCLIAVFVAAYVVFAWRSRVIRAQSAAGAAFDSAKSKAGEIREPAPVVAPLTGPTGIAAKRTRQIAAAARLSRDVRVD